jgi:N,N'-diacetyllegionaminate synthase
MQKVLRVSEASVGTDCPVFIIAEAGVNHNGDAKTAMRLIREAKRAGADCVKFQTFEASRIITRNAPKAEYQLKTTDPNESQFEMLRRLELSLDSYRALLALCREEKIIFMSTPYSLEDVDFLDELGASAFKLASIQVAEPYFLQYVARKGKPMFVSTGMATLAEVDEAVRAIRATGN